MIIYLETQEEINKYSLDGYTIDDTIVQAVGSYEKKIFTRTWTITLL